MASAFVAAAPSWLAPAVSWLAPAVPPLDGGWCDLLLALYIGLAFVALRLAADVWLLPVFERALRPHVPPERLSKTAFKLLDYVIDVVLCAWRAAWAWHVMLTDTGGCTPWTTASCLSTWPDVPLMRPVQLVWLSIAGFYTYEMLGHATGLPCLVLDTEMAVHHTITMAMMLYGYYRGLHRFGLMATALLDTPNVLMYVGKALHCVKIPTFRHLEVGVFAATFVTFFVSNIALPPGSLIKPALIDGRRMPATSYAIGNGLLLMVYGLQLFWFYKLARIALGYLTVARAGGEEKKAQ